MQATPLEKSGFAQNLAASLASLAAFALLAVVLAYWMWAWLAPRPEPRAQAAVPAARAPQAAAGLFGGAPGAHGGAAPAQGTIRLLGVVAAAGTRPSYAVLRLDGKKTVSVLQGGEIEPGLRLAQVAVDHVVIERSGARETLAWPERNSK